MRLKRIVALVAALTLLAPTLSWAGVGVGAGAGYKRMLAELDAAFTRKTGIAVEESFGHMGQIATQAKEGVHLDVVFGDLDFLKSVNGLEVERYVELGRGRLVVAFAKGLTLNTPDDLKNPAVDRIALPDVKSAIYGKAGMEFLTASGLLEAVRPKLLEVSTVPQVSAYLVSGEVKAGLVNVTDAVGVADRIGGYFEVDQKYYAPIKIVCAVMQRAAAKPDLARYLEFLASPEARAIAEKYGL